MPPWVIRLLFKLWRRNYSHRVVKCVEKLVKLWDEYPIILTPNC